MSFNPSVSVIIPTYNAERFLALTIESVIAQTRPNWNLIVIDDGSKDGTVAIAERFAANDARIRVAAYPNGGVVAARNRGFAESRPEIPYLAYLDHDDLWEPNFLEMLLPLLEANPQAVGAHSVARFINSTGEPCEAYGEAVWPRERLCICDGRIEPVARDAPTSFAALVTGNCIATPGQTLLRREVVERAGLFRPDTNPCDDWDLYLRMTQHGELVFVNQILMGWRQHEANVSNDRDRIQRMMRYVRRKLMEQTDLSAEHRRLALAGYRHIERQAGQKWLQSAQSCLTNRRFARALNHTRFALQSYFRALHGQPG